MFNKNSRGQIGETMTWVVATLVMIVVLGISIFVVSTKISLGEITLKKQSDLLASKSLSGYLLTEQNGRKIYNILKSEGELNDENGELAQKIFEKFYVGGKEYDGVWVGYSDENTNSFFGSKIKVRSGGISGKGSVALTITEEIKLDAQKGVELKLYP